MFLAMNRFRIAPGFEEGFEEIWRDRESFLSEVDGFESFALLRGPTVEEPGAEPYTLYASHSVWASRAAFDAWTRSDHFRRAHAQKGAPKGTYLTAPHLETFEQVV